MSEQRTWLERWGHSIESHRTLIQGGVDATSWVVGFYIAVSLRYEFALTPADWGPFSGLDVLLAAMVAVTVQLGVGYANGLYTGRYRYGSFEEVSHLARVAAVVTVLTAVVNRLVPEQFVPTSTVFICGVIALVAMAGTRYVWRLAIEHSMRPSDERAARTLVFGAGNGGEQLVTQMLRDPDSPYLPVGFLDDDPTLRNTRIRGVTVLGARAELAEVVERTGATALCIAIPSATAELIRELSLAAATTGLDVRVLPPLNQLLDHGVGVGDLRPVSEEDLLGRHAIDTDIDAIAGYLTGRRVLVTGAGGSIGSELCRQIARYGPDQLIMLDRDESALHAVQLSIHGRALLDDRSAVVCDIRDLDRLLEVFAEHRPEVVFHAAALKHLPLLEQYPREAYKTNVVGTQHVLDVAADYRVARFVNISTDKAADPTSVLGFTKRIAERLTAARATTTEGTFLSVRFGNVLGSRGSVLTAFRAQIDAGGPVTVTDPEVTRYFMTVEEAVQLVIQAGAVGRDGEALVLDMGESVRIDDVARRLTEQAPRPVEIVYTGLRRGEKLHEQLLGRDEVDLRPSHPLISQVPVPVLEIADVRAAAESAQSDTDLILELRALVIGSAGPAGHGAESITSVPSDLDDVT